MRKIFISNFVSLDGYLAGPGGDLSWHNVNDEFIKYAEDMLESVDTILFGRLTYEMMAAYWPAEHAVTNDPIIAGKMNTLPKIVFSKTLDQADWENSTIIKDDIEAKVKQLKELPGKDMVILGSGTIVSALTEMGLIDEYNILINPVILGEGKPHFTGIADRKQLELMDMKRFSSGLVLLTYQPKNNL